MTKLKSWMYNKKRTTFKKHNVSKQHHNPSERIAFLVDGRNEGEMRTINAYIKKLQQRGKDISLLYITDHSQPEQISFQAFNKKSFNWYYIPKSPVVIDFIQKDFDLLISFNTELIPELEAIMDLSNAKFKIGIMDGHSDLYDLVINPMQEKTWKAYIEILEATLDQLCTEEAYA